MARILTRKGTVITGNPAESLDAGNQKVVNVLDPTNAQDVATKAYVDVTAASASEALDGTFRIKNTADETKQLAFDVSAVSTATTRTLIIPNSNVDLGLVATAIQSSEKGAANGVATLNAAGKLSAGQVPAIAITETFVVADIAARDALTIGTGDGEVQQGDVAIVTDASADPDVDLGAASYIYDGTDWQLLKTPTSAVQSVNGQTGVVVLDTDDVAEGSTNLYYTAARFNTAFSGKSTTDLAEGTNLYFTEARVLGTDLAGFTPSSTDSVVDTDTVLSALEKLQARTKKPNYSAALAPTVNDDDSEGYEVGSFWYDSAANKLYFAEDVSTGAAVWTLINMDAVVTSVNSQTGDVVLDSDDIAEGLTNLYFTEARAKAAAVSDEAYSAVNWDAVTDVAPSKNAVRDVLETKADASTVSAIDGRVTDLEADSGMAFSAGVAGEAFAANGLYFVRRAKNGETTGRYYKAQADSLENARVVGYVVVGGTGLSAADPLKVYKLGTATLGSGDSSFTTSQDENSLVYLSQTVAGKWALNPTTTAGDVIKEIGVVADANLIEFVNGLAFEA